MPSAHQQEEDKKPYEAPSSLSGLRMPHAWPIRIQHGCGCQYDKGRHDQDHNLQRQQGLLALQVLLRAPRGHDGITEMWQAALRCEGIGDASRGIMWPAICFVIANEVGVTVTR